MSVCRWVVMAGLLLGCEREAAGPPAGADAGSAVDSLTLRVGYRDGESAQRLYQALESGAIALAGGELVLLGSWQDGDPTLKPLPSTRQGLARLRRIDAHAHAAGDTSAEVLLRALGEGTVDCATLTWLELLGSAEPGADWKAVALLGRVAPIADRLLLSRVELELRSPAQLSGWRVGLVAPQGHEALFFRQTLSHAGVAPGSVVRLDPADLASLPADIGLVWVPPAAGRTLLMGGALQLSDWVPEDLQSVPPRSDLLVCGSAAAAGLEPLLQGLIHQQASEAPDAPLGQALWPDPADLDPAALGPLLGRPLLAAASRRALIDHKPLERALAGLGTLPPLPSPAPTPGLRAEVRLLQVLDVDGDGRLSEREFAFLAPPWVSFGEHDENGDGNLDAAELLELLWQVPPVLQAHHEGQGQRGPAGPSARHGLEQAAGPPPEPPGFQPDPASGRPAPPPRSGPAGPGRPTPLPAPD